MKSCNANQAATATKIAKKAVGLIRTKNNFARAAHFFLFLFVVISAEDGLHCPLQNRHLDLDSRKFLVTRFREEMSYVFLFNFFFHCRATHFHLGGR